MTMGMIRGELAFFREVSDVKDMLSDTSPRGGLLGDDEDE